MCGISGIIVQSQFSDLERQQKIIDAISTAQVQRGPDYAASETIKTSDLAAIFSHNRLSVVDLSEKAHQPMWDAKKRFCIVFNGMIYNYLELREELVAKGYQFNSESDTEVILNAFCEWGVDALNRFNGMFAFTIFDKQEQKIFLCRDRFAIKPLYYAFRDGTFYFASSSRVLAEKLNLKPNLNYLSQGLRYWCYENNSGHTMYDGLNMLPAGHYLTVCSRNGELSVDKDLYYPLRERVQELNARFCKQEESELIEELKSTLTSAVSLRLRADVPVAVSLSGGLDSSLVTALAAREHPNLIGYTFGHPGDRRTEGPLAEKLANHVGVEVRYIQPEPDEMINAFWQVLREQDAPFPSLSVVAQYLVYQRAKEDGIKVLLGGQGGDEAFMGYRKFFWFGLCYLFRVKKSLAAKFAVSLLPMLRAELPNIAKHLAASRRYLRKKKVKSRLILPEQKLDIGLGDRAPWERQLDDVTQFSLPTLLRYEDRNSMSQSIESRLPFLDYRLMELGLALPIQFKLRDGYAKWALRKVADDLLPAEICWARYKRGFDVLQKDWIKSGLGASMRAHIVKHRGTLLPLLPAHIEVSKVYSDRALIKNQRVLSELITLCWAANRVVA